MIICFLSQELKILSLLRLLEIFYQLETFCLKE